MVDMMAHGGLFPYYDAKEYDCRILAIPYKHNLTTMYIIQPNNSSRSRLRELQATLTADNIENMISQMEYKTTVLLFPKMHMSSSIKLERVLRQMGLSALFDINHSDLSLISNGDDQSVRQSQSPFSGVSSQGSPTQSSQFINRPIATTPLASSAPTTNTWHNHVPNHRYPGYEDDSDSGTLIFSRLGESEDVAPNNKTNRQRRTTAAPNNRRKRNAVSYKAQASFVQDDEPPRLKDYVLNKRLSKSYSHKKSVRSKRQSGLFDPSARLKSLDELRDGATAHGLPNPHLFVNEIVHKVNLEINEKGTEGGAATATYLSRTGTDVVFRVDTPFMFLIRHEDTKLTIFYGTVYDPTDA